MMKQDPYHGIKVVVNGCFDLFHDGHKYLLDYALYLCGQGKILILLNSDSSICTLKGKNRPIDPFYSRKNNIYSYAKLRCLATRIYPYMDIHKFDTEEQLEELINNFQPNIIVKGNDRTNIKEIVGSKKWPVVILPRLEGLSTTKLIEEINGKETDIRNEEADR